MSVILPGNWVTHANVYPRKKKLADGTSVIERHGVECVPGYAFYKLVGYYASSDDTVPAGDLDLVIGSPDLRQDDKPRLDAPFILPKDALVYRTAVSAVNVKAKAASDTLTLKAIDEPTATGSGTLAGPFAVSTADANKDFPGAANPASPAPLDFNGASAVTAGDVKIQVTASDDLSRDDKRDWLVILVEVDYYVDAGGPGLDEIHAPYLIEAGQDKAY